MASRARRYPFSLLVWNQIVSITSAGITSRTVQVAKTTLVEKSAMVMMIMVRPCMANWARPS